MHETRPTPDDGVRIVQRLQFRTAEELEPIVLFEKFMITLQVLPCHLLLHVLDRYPFILQCLIPKMHKRS